MIFLSSCVQHHLKIMCNLSTYFEKKKITKKLKFNGCVSYQPILTKETVRWKLGLIKEENKHKKEADQNSMYLVLLTLVTL